MTTIVPTFPADQLPEPPPRRRRWLSLLLAVVIFVAGLVCGAGFTVIVVVKRIQNAIHNPQIAATQISAAIDRRLDLNDSQREQVERIVARRQQNLVAIRRQVQPEVEAELNELRDEVAGVLDESQQQEWQTLFDRFRSRWLPKLPSPNNK
jgi:cell division protein FtsB